MSHPSNRDRNRILLHGGPAGGREYSIPENLEQTGYFRVPIGEPSPLSVSDSVIYTCRDMFAGKPGTCEFREWTEWHYLTQESGR